MSDPPTNHELVRQVAVLEERMNTHVERFNAAIERMERRAAERDAEAARRDAEAAKRDRDNTRWMVGVVVAATVVIGILVRWPGG